MAGKHVGTDQYTTAYTHKPAYPDRVNRAWAEGFGAPPGTPNPHTPGSPAALAWTAGDNATFHEEAAGSVHAGPSQIFVDFSAGGLRINQAAPIDNTANVTALSVSYFVRNLAVAAASRGWSAGHATNGVVVEHFFSASDERADMGNGLGTQSGSAATGSAPTLGGTHHYMITWDAADAIRYYRDGVEIANDAADTITTIDLTLINRIKIGERFDFTTPGTLDAELADIYWIQGVQASPAQVAAIAGGLYGGADGTGYGLGNPNVWLAGSNLITGTNTAPVATSYGNFEVRGTLTPT